MNATFQQPLLDEDELGFSALLVPCDVPPEAVERIFCLLQSVGLVVMGTFDADFETSASVSEYFTLSSRNARPCVCDGVGASLLVFAADVMPRAPDVDAPFDNKRTLACQRMARDLLQPFTRRKSPSPTIWMTARSAEAWRALARVQPDCAPRYKDRIRAMREEFEGELPIALLTGYGDRANVELVQFDGQRAVRKTYRPTALHLLACEAQVMQDLSGKLPEIPRLLARGPNFLVMELLDGHEITTRWRERPQPLPLPKVREIADFLRRCVAEGYDPVDFKPARNVFYRECGICVFDFEYWRKSHPASVKETYCLNGVPEDDAGDRPVLTRSWSNPYPSGWFPYVCLSKNSFLDDPAWLQRLKRPWFISLAYLQWSGRLFARAAELMRGRGW